MNFIEKKRLAESELGILTVLEIENKTLEHLKGKLIKKEATK